MLTYHQDFLPLTDDENQNIILKNLIPNMALKNYVIKRTKVLN